LLFLKKTGPLGEQWSFANPVTKQNNKEIDIGHSEKEGTLDSP